MLCQVWSGWVGYLWFGNLGQVRPGFSVKDRLGNVVIDYVNLGEGLPGFIRLVQVTFDSLC